MSTAFLIAYYVVFVNNIFANELSGPINEKKRDIKSYNGTLLKHFLQLLQTSKSHV